ncbi:GntR family transcriptional regulator [Roseicyclus mahoneyensis]|uniref:GntR family transcriptional regulator n=1 Tax=Roseicyclus mahoneyensis TaxID=164332 RepID=A0A316GE66_9RHOB|nr:GntR family transcriptional regulator [Roseicyclus mahoneyensis]
MVDSGNTKNWKPKLWPLGGLVLRETDVIDAPRSSSDAIAEVLIADIKAGRQPKGEPLPTERELSERFDASRPTVRAALSQMQMRGYLEAQPGHRPRASSPSLDSILRGAADHIRDILGDAEAGAHLEQMRQFIETGAARAATMRADTVHLAKLNEALTRNAEAIGTPDFAQTDIAFHRALVSVVGNPILLTLHDMFVSRLFADRPPVADPIANDRISHEEHRAIYTAILDGDVAAATDVMEAHLARSLRRRLKAAALGSQAPAAPQA